MLSPSPTHGRSQSTKFYWGAVSTTTGRALLHAAYGDDPDLAQRAQTWTADRLADRLREVFGSPPKMDKLERWGAWDALHQWAMKEASKEQLATLVSYAMASLPVNERLDARSTLANLRAFVDRRNRTVAFRTNLRVAFIQAHKRSQPIDAGHGRGRSSRSGSLSLVWLRGADVPADRAPYLHQLEARDRLDALMMQTKASQRRGLIVLPTGAGKTSTIVDWLVPRMAADQAVRVLWLAHQHELLVQAAHAFELAARREPPDFIRKLRVISSSGSATSTLAEDDLDVALVTWQSLNRGWDQHRARVRRLFQRPTVVIVDEAHHAAAPGYQRVLTDVQDRPQAALIGLTATPWPGQDGAGRRLRATFPVDILTRTPEQMHEQGILATPIFHTVDTGRHLELTDTELRLSKGDLAPAVLKRLVNDARDDLLVRTWTAHRAHWGKTLVFATSRDHADRLGEKLHAAGVSAQVAHSTSAVHVRDALSWFRNQRGPAVLVSVGMLTEGVDIPDARTAFLARPTTSRILMRQMIGRVLRGERAGGENTAHIVYFRDQWTNFDEVIEPGELPGFGGSVATTPGSGPEHQMPPVLDASGIEIGEDVLAQIRRMYSTRMAALPLDPMMTAAELVGYYALHDLNVPVMEHQRDTYQAMIKKALANNRFTGAPALSMFDTDPPPYPTARAVHAVLGHVRTYETVPTFVSIKAQVSSFSIARKLRDAPAMDEDARESWLGKEFESSLARLAYESFEHFEEAVDRDLRELRRSRRGRLLNPEMLEPRRPSATMPKLIRSATRPLPSLRSVASAMREHLAGEMVLERLDDSDLPELAWTARVGPKAWPAAWAYWTMKNTGQLKGQGVIRVHLSLRAPRSQISDEVLAYLVFHELLHHLLPGQGHSAEFRRLERLWPDADALDVTLDTLHERYRVPTSVE